jgi:hypothetical protein
MMQKWWKHWNRRYALASRVVAVAVIAVAVGVEIAVAEEKEQV